MISVGPYPMSFALLLAAVVIAVGAGRVGARASGEPAVKVTSHILDMLMAGALIARLAFVVQWWPEYTADPWSIIRIGDGGFSIWAGVLAGVAVGAWRARKDVRLRRPLAIAASAGLAAWFVLGGVLALMQASTLSLPATELSVLDGSEHETTTLASMAGKPIVVNLWASWCPPCRREMPALADAQARRTDVTFAFVNQGESADTVRDYLRGVDLSLRNVLLDVFSSVSRDAGARGLPTTLFFAADGRLVDVHVGELTNASLMRKLEQFQSAD